MLQIFSFLLEVLFLWTLVKFTVSTVVASTACFRIESFWAAGAPLILSFNLISRSKGSYSGVLVVFVRPAYTGMDTAAFLGRSFPASILIAASISASFSNDRWLVL